MSVSAETAPAALAAIVGASQVATDPAACAAMAVDGQTPECVVYPTTPEEVAAVLRSAAEHHWAVIPYRSATKLHVGNPPRRYDIALSLKDMNQVWHYEPNDLTITVEPGMKFGDFQHFVGRQGLWLPLDPPGGARASMGGIVATNAAGPLRLAYGAPRDIVLGMKIATVQGKVFKAGGRVVKNVTGYDIGKLLIGSFGTLGVVVETSFKLFPLPPERATFTAAAGTLGIARDLRRRILASPLGAARVVLLNAPAAQLAAGNAVAGPREEPEIWLEMAGSVRLMERCNRELGELAQAAGAQFRRVEPADAGAFWARVTDLRASIVQPSDSMPVLKATLPDSAVEELISRAEQEAESEKVRLAAFAQLGVGIVHFAMLSETPVTGAVRLIRRLREAAEGLGGVLVVERCALEVKQQVDVWGVPGDDYPLMRKMKAAWDPKGVLSPGRFLGCL